MTDIYLHIVARVADYFATHPYGYVVYKPAEGLEYHNKRVSVEKNVEAG